MTKEKQIEEMARDLCHLTCTCEECGNVAEVNKHRCKAKVYARRAYNAGYRKQSEGEWVRGGTFEHCSMCGQVINVNNVPMYLYNYCPNCGSKMKGE